MKNIRQVILKSPPRGTPRYNHPWIYRSQIKAVEPGVQPGDVVEVLTSGKRWLGIGYYNPASEIAVRLISSTPQIPDKKFFLTQIQKAAAFREFHAKETNAYRLISSEADGLPGLIIDRYDERVVVQFLTLGMDRLRAEVLSAIDESGVAPRGVYERSDSGSRRLEGLGERVGWIRKDCGDEVVIHEGSIRYRIRFSEGQKTGFYLDQRENRLFLGAYGVRGRVLDAFCHSGGFGLHLARSGCQVLAIDSQAEAIGLAEENRALNGLTAEQLVFRTANVFDELRVLEKDRERFDLVILDPPSFVKRKDAVAGALAGYKDILLRGMRLLNEGGLLAVFSCSYHVDDNLLMQTSLFAAEDVRKKLRVIKFFKQSADHPIDPFIPETYYLKGFLFSVS